MSVVTITEPARAIPVLASVDVCVLGGSCTGVFAAARAARLGASVAIVEKTNCFGGVATNGLVNIWHSLLDTVGKRTIIAGLTREVAGRLEGRGAARLDENSPDCGFRLNTEELKIELDKLTVEHGVTPFLHTSYCAPLIEGDRVMAAFVENKDGRGAIRARVFIDATGDGDLAAHAGVPFGVADDLQPPTTCAKIGHFWAPDFGFRECYRAHRDEFGLPVDSGWAGQIPGVADTQMVAENHVFGANCANAAELTRAEIEGRRVVRAQMDMVRKYGPQGGDLALLALASYIGIRETRRFRADYTLTESDVLSGQRFGDAIANGSYRVDVHNPAGGGFVFKYLDGTSCSIGPDGKQQGRWRDEIDEDPTFYQIPYRTMVSRRVANLIMAGRMIATDRGAFGATRVMVNLNQTGEAAGVAAVLAQAADCHVADVPAVRLREALAAGGSVVI